MHAPPGPKVRTPFGQLFAVRRDVLGFLTTLAADHGDVAAFRVGPFRVVLLNHPNHVRDVLLTNHRNFVKGRPLRLASLLLGEGLLTSEGEFHARQSRIVSPSLQVERLQGYAPVVTDYASRLDARWADGEEVDMLDEMIRLATAIAARTMFDWDVDSMAARGIAHALDDATRLFSRVTLPFAEQLLKLPLPGSRRFHRAKAYLDAAIYRVIEERRRNGVQAGDLLSRLIEARDSEADQAHMTDLQVRDEALTLFLTAFDTVSLALTWTWYSLARHPEVEATLATELERVLAGRLPRAEDLAALPYTRMLLSETMRLYPPIYAIAREAVSDFTAGGYTISAGTLVLMSPYLLQRDQRFFADPACFDPMRWNSATGSRPPRFAYFPFGGGPRACIGRAYGVQEAVLVIATLAQRWRMRLVPNRPITLRPLLNLRPENGIRMVVERRAASTRPGAAAGA